MGFVLLATSSALPTSPRAKWKLSLIRLSFNFFAFFIFLLLYFVFVAFTSRWKHENLKNCYFILQVQHYILVVQAQDNGHPSLSSTLTVYCNVIDLNDNAPVFDPMSYSNEIYENVLIGTEVVTVSATDTDSGKFLFFSINKLFWLLNFLLTNLPDKAQVNNDHHRLIIVPLFVES